MMALAAPVVGRAAERPTDGTGTRTQLLTIPTLLTEANRTRRRHFISEGSEAEWNECKDELVDAELFPACGATRTSRDLLVEAAN